MWKEQIFILIVAQDIAVWKEEHKTVLSKFVVYSVRW